MREKLQTLPLAELKELAKVQGIKGISIMKKSEIIDLLREKADEETTREAIAVAAQITKPSTPPAQQTAPQSQGSSVASGSRPQTQSRPYRPHQSAEGGNRTAKVQPQMAEEETKKLDSGIEANGILEIMPDEFGFVRCENCPPGENDVCVAPSQIRRLSMKIGDIIVGSRRVKTVAEKFAALLYVKTINGYPPAMAERRSNFEDLTPVFPNERLRTETPGGSSMTAMRVLDLLFPIGKG